MTGQFLGDKGKEDTSSQEPQEIEKGLARVRTFLFIGTEGYEDPPYTCEDHQGDEIEESNQAERGKASFRPHKKKGTSTESNKRLSRKMEEGSLCHDIDRYRVHNTCVKWPHIALNSPSSMVKDQPSAVLSHLHLIGILHPRDTIDC